jgi:D-tyrosyl-tRNA(Tyr) deacylase
LNTQDKKFDLATTSLAVQELHGCSILYACTVPKIFQANRMRAVIQRVREASVTVDGRQICRIGPGLLVLLGVEAVDEASDVAWLAPKVAKLRIFADSEGKMNRAVSEAGGEVIVVSQFTLHAATQKGNRPSFIRAAAPALSEPLYTAFCAAMEGELGKPIGRGIFGADMQVALVNDGPVTVLIDTRQRE